MKKIIDRMKLIFAIVILAGMIIPSNIVLAGASGQLQASEETKVDYKKAVTNLKDLISNTPSMEQEIDKALKIQPKNSYWDGKTSDDFVKFFEEWLVENPVPGDPAKYIRPFDELANSEAGEILFNNNVFSSWFIAFVNAKGQYLDTASSAATMDQWMSYPDVNINDYIVPKGGFKTFNEFFLRSFKPGTRPLDGKNDPSVIVSPADGTVCQIYAEDLGTNFEIKRDVINIRQALNNSPYADRFIGGLALDILLWFTDYHFFHSPVSGKIVEVGEYAGSYNYNFANVNWYKQLAKHKRTCYIIETTEFGLVAMIPVGFWGVGSIITEPEVKVGNYIKKGEEIGHFKYGGSSILLIFEPDVVKFTLSIPVQVTGDEGISVKVRQKIGISTKPASK